MLCLAPVGGYVGCCPSLGRHWGMLPCGAQHPSGCLAGTVGTGSPSTGDPGHKPIPPLGAQEEVTPGVLGHAGGVQGTLGAAGLLRSPGPLSLLPPDAWGASARLTEPPNLPKGFLQAHGLCPWVLHAAGLGAQHSPPGCLSQNLALGKIRAGARLGNACGSPPLPSPLSGDAGSCPSLLSGVGELLPSTCGYFPSPKVGSKPAPAQEEAWHTHHRFTTKCPGLGLCRWELVAVAPAENWVHPEESTGPEPAWPGDEGGLDPWLATAGATSNCPLLFFSRAG